MGVMQIRRMPLPSFLLLPFYFLLFSCSVSKQISKQANTILLNDTAISTGHIGISIYEPATNTYWYNYNATKNLYRQVIQNCLHCMQA